MSIALTPLEDAVMSALLAGDHPVLAALRAQRAHLEVSARDNTGGGFYVDFAPGSETAAAPVEQRLLIGDVEATIETLSHGAGFLLYVEHGLITCLEGYSYDEPWPEQIGEFSLRYHDSARAKLFTDLPTVK